MFFFLVGTVCLRNNWDNCACLAVVLPASNHNTCEQWRLSLITQHKPIERSTDMVSWPKNLKFKLDWTVFTWKTCMSSAWLQSMFMHGRVPASRRPGTRDDKMQPNLAPPLPQRTIWRSRISKSKSDLVAHNSGSWGVRLLHDVLALFFRWRCKTFGLVVLLPFKLWLFREPICKIVYFELWTGCLLGKRPMCIPRYDFAKVLILPQYHFAKILFCRSIILSKYDFAKVSCCQSIVLPKFTCPKYCDAKWSKLSLAKYQFATICLQNDEPKSSQNNNLGRPHTPHFAQSPGVMVPLGPSSPVIATTSYPNIFQISILAWGDGSTGTIVLF